MSLWIIRIINPLAVIKYFSEEEAAEDVLRGVEQRQKLK